MALASKYKVKLVVTCTVIRKYTDLNTLSSGLSIHFQESILLFEIAGTESFILKFSLVPPPPFTRSPKKKTMLNSFVSGWLFANDVPFSMEWK